MDGHPRGMKTTTTEAIRVRLTRHAFGRGSLGRYALIGISGVLLDLLVFTILVASTLAPVAATAIGTLVGILNNYTWNSLVNFRLKLSGRRGAKFLAVGVTGLVTSAGLLHLLMLWGAAPVDAKWMSIPIVVSGQFIANKFWTFR